MAKTAPHPGRPAWWEVIAALLVVALLVPFAPGPLACALVTTAIAWSRATCSRAPRSLLVAAAAVGGAIGGAVQWFAHDAAIAERLGPDFVKLGDFAEHLTGGATYGAAIVGMVALVVESGTPGARARPRARGTLPVGRREAPRLIVLLLGLVLIGVFGAAIVTKPVGRHSRAFELRHVQRKLDQLMTQQAAYRRAAGRYAATIEELGIDTTRSARTDPAASTDPLSFPGLVVVIEMAGADAWTGSVAGSAVDDPRALIRCRAVVTGDRVERECRSPNLNRE